MFACLSDLRLYPVQLPRKKWVLQWPGQVVICASSIFWTTEVSEAIVNNTLPVSLRCHASALAVAPSWCVPQTRSSLIFPPSPLQDYVQQCNDQISDIVELVRGKLPGGARMTLGALTVIDVHGIPAHIVV